MTSAATVIRSIGAELCRPWPRHILSTGDWQAMAAALQDDPLRLLALWADTVQVHALFLNPTDGAALAASVDVEAGCYPALSPTRAGAAWFERMVHDLWGHRAVNGTDQRPWLDHGLWTHTAPLAARPAPPAPEREPPQFLGDPESSHMQWPIGPVTGDLGEAVHLRLTLQGDRILRAEARLGYTHKGTLALMRGKSPRTAARFAARLTGDATVAHSIAFATATEAALGVEPPPRAAALRAMMAEVERLVGHLDQLAMVAAHAHAPDIEARCSTGREWLMRAASIAFGHRLMMDVVVPGGVSADLAIEGPRALLRAMGAIATDLPDLRRAFEGSLLGGRLIGTAMVTQAELQRFSVGGVAARAAGLRYDVRRLAPVYVPLRLVPAIDTGGDAAARVRVRLLEIGESLRLVAALIESLPDGPTTVALPMNSGEGVGCAESIHGDVWHWLRLDHGQIAAVFPRDPGWALWPLAETMLMAAPVEDVGVIQSSLGLPVSGMDL
jgi:Ni,Fe-hydrogenase III large subunit